VGGGRPLTPKCTGLLEEKRQVKKKKTVTAGISISGTFSGRKEAGRRFDAGGGEGENAERANRSLKNGKGKLAD